MTEKEWISCSNPQKMLEFLYQGGKWSDRKLRLLGCACCRKVWNLLTENCFQNAVKVAERFADGQAGSKELATARKESEAALQRNQREGVNDRKYFALGSAWSCSRKNPEMAAWYPLSCFTAEEEFQWEVLLIKDIFVNPFRPVTFDLAWRTDNALAVAQTIYDERRFTDMPILADALEEAGCTSQEMLDHCRNRGEHVRGCWVVDLVLGKS